MNAVERYLHEITGTPVSLNRVPLKKGVDLPLFMKRLYAFKKGTLFGREIIFLEKTNGEHLTADQLRKHGEIVEKALNSPVVFILPFLEAYNRKRLIQKKVAFVVPGKQLFIPQLLIDLKEVRRPEQNHNGKLMPAAQCLLLFHLLKENIEPLNLKAVAEKLGYAQMTVTRAARMLEEKKLAVIEGARGKRIVFGQDKKALWQNALPLLQTPVKKVYFLEQPPQTDVTYHASFSALARYTDLAEGDKQYFAVSQKDFETLKKQIQIVPSNEADVHLEVWKYAPGVLAKDRFVDPLSLFLSLKDQEDERVQKALETLLEQVW